MSEVNTAPAPVVTSPMETASVTAPPPSSGISEPWAKDWIKPDFTFDHKALERLPEHLKGLKPSLERTRSLEEFLTVHQNQQVLVGKKALAPLPADAPDPVKAERKALLDTIQGVPPSPKDYGIARPQDIPEGQWDGKLADSASQWAHKNSVSPAALKELMGIQVGAMKENMAAQQAYEAQFYTQQDQTFASAIQRENIPADRASALVEKGALALGLDLNNEQTKNFLKGSDARLMAMRHALAIGEDRAIPEGGGNQGTDQNPADLAKDATTNPANPLYGPYWNRDGKYSRSAQESAIQKVNGWHQQAAAKTPPRTPRR